MRKGTHHTQETILKMSSAQMGNINKRGTHLSPEGRARISKASKGRIPSAETRAKTSMAMKGKMTEEWKEKIRLGNKLHPKNPKGGPIQLMRRKGTESLKLRIQELQNLGASIVWSELSGKIPDVVYILNGMVIAEDVKSSGRHEVDGSAIIK